MAKKAVKESKVSGLIFLAGLFIGIGVGMLYGQVAVGTLIGLGVGFLGAAFTYAAVKKK